MRRVLFIAILGLLAIVVAKAYADSARVTVVLLIDSACEKQDMVKRTMKNPMACVDGPLWRTVADYQAIQQWVNVVYVVDYKWGEHIGRAWIDEHYAISQAMPSAIAHEIKHLEEQKHCTSDGYHDHDYVCQYERLPLT